MKRSSQKHQLFIGVLAVVLASACYGVTPIISNACLRGGFPAEFVSRFFADGPFAAAILADPARAVNNEQLVCFSMGIACLLSLLSCAVSRKKLAVSGKQLWQLAVFGGGALAGTLLLITYAYLRIPAGMTIVINFTYPVFVAIAGIIFFREKPKPLVFVSLALAIFGIALISWAGLSGEVNAAGVVIAVLSGAAYAVYFIAGRRSSYAGLDTGVSNVYITGAASLLALAIALAASRFALPRDPVMWGLLFLEALLGYVVGLRLLLLGIRLLGSTPASALNTLEPAFASLTSMLVFGEAMGLLKGLGVLLVLAAALISIIALRKKAE